MAGTSSGKRIVKVGHRGDNEGMNLFLALFWLSCAVVLVAYEIYIGGWRSQVRVAGHLVPRTWLLVSAALLLTVYNLWRWRRLRAYRARQRQAEIDRAALESQRLRASGPLPPPDPHFNFSDEPPAHER